MKQYTFKELGYFSQRECEKIREKLQGKTFMRFGVGWVNQAGNCNLVISTDYDAPESEVKEMFLHAALSAI